MSEITPEEFAALVIDLHQDTKEEHMVFMKKVFDHFAEHGYSVEMGKLLFNGLLSIILDAFLTVCNAKDEAS